MKQNNFRFGSRSLEKLTGADINGRKVNEPVHEKTRELCDVALSVSTIDFSVIDGFRTAEQQKALFDKGVTTLNGTTKISYHQTGLAVDVIPVIRTNNGEKLNPFDVNDDRVKLAWLELYRAFMRAAFKLKLHIEFGFGYNIGKHGGRDWPHVQIMPKDKTSF